MKMFHTPCFLFLVLTPILTIVSFSHAASAESFPIRWEESYGLGIVSHPLGIDLGQDGKPEIILTDNEGNVVVLDMETGKEKWSEDCGGVALLSPLVGRFLPGGAQQLLVCGNDKKIRLFDPNSGRLMGTIPIDFQPFLNPTLYPGQFADGGTESFILIDDSGNVAHMRLTSPTEVETIWTYKTSSQAKTPAVVGPVASLAGDNVVVADYSGIITVLDGANGSTVLSYRFPKNHEISSGIALAQLDGPPEQEEILVADERGYLQAFRAGQALQPLWDKPVSIVANPLETLAAMDLNNDGVADTVSSAHGDLVFVDGLSGERFIWSATNPPIKTPPVVVTAVDGKKYVFVIDSKGTFYAISLDGRSAKTMGQVGAGGDFASTLIAAAIGAQKQIAIFAISKMGGNAVCIGTPLTSGSVDPVLWETLGGTMVRTGNKGARSLQRWNASLQLRASALNLAVQEMKQSVEAGKWGEAREQAERVLNLEPGNEEAADILARAAFKARLPYYITGVVLFAIAAFLIGRPIYRIYWRKSQLKQGETAVQDGMFDAARKIYSRLLERYPEDKDVNAQLAILYMKQGEYSAESIAVYERMYRHSPDNLPILQALARTYLNAHRQDDQALEVYVKVSDQFDEPGRLNHALGEIYHGRGDDKSALAFLRKAMREDYRLHELILLLADVYLNLNVRAAAGIPIYEAACAARPQDTRVLIALAESYAAAQHTDEAAEDVYERLLELNPEHKTIRLMLARIKLREGACDEAARHASAVLDAQPDSRDAVGILSQACLAVGRVDDEALAIYRRSAKEFSDDAVLLKSIARVCLENESELDDVSDLILAAYQKNQDDPALTRAVHQIALTRNDEPLALETAERLARAGEATPEIWSTLAAIYCEKNSRGDLVEAALKNEMVSEDCDPRVVEMLGAIYAESDRVDAAALGIYEALSQKGKLAADVGEKFVHALLESGRVEDALKHSKSLLEHFPQSEGLRRLSARANMESNQVDEAVKQYETILSGHPEDPEAVVALATAYAKKNRLDDTAMLLYAHAQQVAPDNPLFPIMKARTMAEEGNWPATSETLKETVLKNENAAAMVHEEAMKILQANPSALPLRWLVVSLAFGLNNPAEALEQVVMIQERDPRQTPQAVEALDKLLAKEPQNGVGHFHRGRMLRNMQKIDEARASLETAFSLMPGDQRVQSELAAVYEMVLKENPSSTEADELRFRLGKMCMGLKSYDKAIQCFQATMQDFRYETDSIKGLAECFMAKGMLDLALQEFKKLHIDDEIKDLLYELAQRYEQKHDLVGAKTVYKQLFAADISYRNVREKFEALAGSTSDPLVFEKTSILNSLSDAAKRRYELIEEIGRGAMGIVYKAHDNELNEVVALKILPDNLSNNPEALQRFKAEARSARRLAHPNIVRIHDIGEEMGRKYISMEFVEGTDLKKNLRSKGIPPFEELLAYARQICAAIAYAHGEGIIHRDIKPANIMLTKDQRIKVTDFGIAKVCESPDATLAGAIMGTPLYMSPEQVQGIPVDKRTDIYSLGILFYELVNGRPPFTEGDLAYQHTHVEPKPLENVPKAFWNVVSCALKKDREERWATVDVMLSELMKAD